MGLVDVTMLEVGEHLLGGNLVVVRLVRHLLDGEGVVDDVGMVDDGVLHEHLDGVADELLTVVPDDGVVVHGHAGVEGVVDEGVADGLDVDAVCAHLVVGVDLAVDGVGVDVEGEDLERVGVHEERVALGVVDGDGTVGTHGIAERVAVLAVVAGELVLVDGIDVDDVVIGLADARLLVVPDAVADEHLALVAEDGAIEEAGPLVAGVVVAALGVDMAASRSDVGWSDNLGHAGMGVVVERVSGEVHVGGAHLDVEVEDGNLRIGIILAPVGDEVGLAVDHLAALEEVGVVVEAVEVQAVGIEGRLAVAQLNVIAGHSHLVVAVVVSIVAEEREGVALIHFDMAEGLEGVGGLVEIGTVAMEGGSFVAELDLAVEDLGFGVDVAVVTEAVGMYEVDVLVLRSGATRLLLGGKGGGGGKGQQQGCGNAAAQPTEGGGGGSAGRAGGSTGRTGQGGASTGRTGGNAGRGDGSVHLIQPWYSKSQSR